MLTWHKKEPVGWGIYPVVVHFALFGRFGMVVFMGVWCYSSAVRMTPL